MLRLLIADSTGVLSNAIVKELGDEYLVEVCHDGERALDLVCAFDPDIFVMDTMLTVVDSLSVLQALRASGRNTKVLVITCSAVEYVLTQLAALGVSYVIPKPCTVGLVVSHIRDVGFQLQYPDMSDWCVENEIDRILLSLGFRMGPSRYRCVWQAVLYKYRNPNCESMKVLYTDVAKVCGGGSGRVEKAIRDSIEDAYKCGDKSLWKMYFQPRENAQKPHPNNEDFIAKIANCLIQKARIKKPYVLRKENVQ